ncbi:MFS transporter [Amycolatopsis halotolerans]|uniref:MFS transporter n=1 Tax=Amycolatopsis halotolerans TaxID=330083 RepID=A0ABV7Q809_9PSEU
MTTVPAPAVPRRAGLAMFVLAFASFMDLLDVGIVTVVVPVIQRDLGATYAQSQWFVVAYVLAFSIVLVVGGRLGDSYGRRRVFLIGVTGFTVLSACCAAAPTAGLFIAARLLQGAFGALMTPQVFAMMQVLFRPEQRGTGFLIYGAVINLAQIGAPLLGGILATQDLLGLGWRAIFLVNVPIGAAIAVAARALVGESRPDRRPALDPVGIVLIAVVTALAVVPLQQGREAHWPWWLFAMLAAVPPLLAVLIRYERKRGPDAVLPTSLFRSRSFSAAGLLAMLVLSSVISVNLVLVWFTQLALGWTPMRTAAGLVGFAVALVAVGTWGAKRVPSFGRGTVATGAVLMAAGVGLLSVLVDLAGAAVSPLAVSAALFVSGSGMALVVGTLVNIQLRDVPERDAGAAGGILSAVFQFAGAVGVGVAAAVFFALVARGGSQDLSAPVGTPQAAFSTCVHDQTAGPNPFAPPDSCRVPELRGPAVAAALTGAKQRAFADATTTTLWVQAGVLLLAAALCRLLPARRSG